MLKEKIKTYILFILIFTSLLQVGILWDYQGPGFPFTFLEAFSRMKNAYAEGPDKIKKDVFEPYRLVMSAGQDEPHWILNKNGETQDEYAQLWKEAEYYLKCILNGDNIISSTSARDLRDVKVWDDLAVKKGIFYEFKTTLKTGVLSYFIPETNSQTTEISGVQKMMITPWEEINYDSFVVYILDGNSRLQKYIISGKDAGLKKERYDEISAELYKLSENNSLRSYSVIADTKNTMLFPVQKDIPIILRTDSKFESIQSLSSTIPENYAIKSGQKISEVEKKFEAILGSEKDNYDVSVDGAGIATLKNLNNIYKLYESGLLEYRNLSVAADSEKLDESQSIKTAIEFLERMKLVPANVDLYISGVQEFRGRTRITFDYKVGGLPVIFNYPVQGSETNVLKNAITMEVANKKVISCWWILRNLELVKDKKQYIVNFVDLMDKTFIDYPTLKTDKSFSMRDATLGYEVQQDTKNTKVEPGWFIFTDTDERYPVKLTVKKGE